MNVLDPPDAYGYTTFCDDIRLEVGGKFTLVGVYGGQMVAHAAALPTILPKLSLAIQYRQRYDRVVLPVQFRIYFPWQPEQPVIIDPPDEHILPAIESARMLSERVGEVAFANVGFSFTFVPFAIVSPGIVKVRAMRGDDMVRLGGIEIIVAAPETPQAAPAQS